MTKPYIHWDPSINAALYVRHGGDPLVVDDSNPERFDSLVTKSCRVNMFSDPSVDYVQTLARVVGSQPETGLRIQAFQYMPNGLTFWTADPANGEPLPLATADSVGAPWSMSPTYLTLGWRMQLRGYLGSMDGSGMTADVKVGWADGKGFRDASQARGGYTGVMLRSMYLSPGLDPVMQHTFTALHGKRPADTNWSYHPCEFNQGGSSAGALTTLNGVDNDRVRVIFAGGTPSDIQIQRYTGGSWVSLHSNTVDLTTFVPAGQNDHLVVLAELFAGNALVRPVSPTVWPDSETWFNSVEMTQFEPFVLDKSDWGYREWEGHWSWLASGVTYLLERRLPAMDLIHHSPGVAGGPTHLRISDNDLGICVEFNELTYLRALAPWDLAGFFVTANVAPVVCDEAAYGYQAPFAMIGRFKFSKIETWSTSYPVDILAAGKPWSATPATNNGMGVYWANTGAGGQGKLVARAWDDYAVAWVDLEFKFNAEDWNDRPVDIAIAWTGARGVTVGRQNFEFRLVIDGKTRAAVLNSTIRVFGTTQLTIGSEVGIDLISPVRRSFVGLFREGMVFPSAMSDGDFVKVWDDTPAIDNYSFEMADPSNRPGEAEGWVWRSAQAIGAWALYNNYRSDLTQWVVSRENFFAGHHFPLDYEYADETARLGATGFVADDVGKVAWQRGDDTKWILTGYSPIAWQVVDVGTSEDWADILEAIAHIFNAGASQYESTVEEWAIFGFPNAPLALQSGPPWLDAYALISPATDTPSVGFDGWYDALYGTSAYPLAVDSFGEAWGNDPLSTSGGPLWYPGGAVNGKLYGEALEFPFAVVPDKQFLTIYLDTSQIVMMELTVGDYADAAALVSMLNTVWQSHVGVGIGVEFFTWTRDGDTGLTFGWDGSFVTSFASMFARRANWYHNDARSSLGFGETIGKIIMPAELVVTLPGGVTSDENFYLDGFSFFVFDIQYAPTIWGYFSVEYGAVAAIFGAFDGTPDPVILERFTLVGWFGSGAVWKDAFTGGDLTAALFDSGANSRENFIAANWPDYTP